ncbi:MAG: hypothetical protein AABY18_01525 [Candidatus Thermoplasmatota archaeon]
MLDGLTAATISYGSPEASGDDVMCSGPAVSVQEGEGVVDIRRNTLSYQGGNGTTGIHWAYQSGGRPGSFQGLDISGYAVGVDGRLARVAIDGMRITDCSVGLRTMAGTTPSGFPQESAPDTLHAAHVVVEDCRPEIPVGCAEPITPEGPHFLWWQCTPVGLLFEQVAAELTDITLRNVTVGIDAAFDGDLSLTGFRIEGGLYGLRSHIPYSPGSILLRDGVIANATFVGAETTTLNLVVDGVTFRDNGRGWPDLSRTDYRVEALRDEAYWYGGLVARVDHGWPVPAPLVLMVNNVVHGSQFIGNVPYGLSTPDIRLIDASGNWWNSVTGPTVRGPLLAPPPATGDAVSDGVQYQPFLTQPP